MNIKKRPLEQDKCQLTGVTADLTLEGLLGHSGGGEVKMPSPGFQENSKFPRV